MLLDDVGRMSVQYVGHFLILFELFSKLIKETDRLCPLASVQWASGGDTVAFLPGFPFHSILQFGPISTKMWHLEMKYLILCSSDQWECGGFFCSQCESVWSDFFFLSRNNFVFVMPSAAVHRVPTLGLEGESGLWRAQSHPAGEQEAGQSLGESVSQ